MKPYRKIHCSLNRIWGPLAFLTVGLAASGYSQTADGFNPGANGTVLAMAVQADGRIFVAGQFTTLGGQPRNYIGRVNAEGVLDPDFSLVADRQVNCLAIQEAGKVLLGGLFTKLAGQPHAGIARLNADGTVDTNFNGSVFGSLNCLLVQADGKILVGGQFTTLDGQPRGCIGRLNADGSLDTTFNGTVGGTVNSLALQADGKILVGGYFSTLGGQPHGNIGRLNADGTVDSSFTPNTDGVVNCLAVQADGEILLAGLFRTLGGAPHASIGRLNGDGTLDTDFNATADGIVNCLVLQADGGILLGGSFTGLNLQWQHYLGRLNPNGLLDTSFNAIPNSSVNCLVMQAEGSILVGGAFTTLGGQARNRIGRLLNTAPATQSLVLDTSTLTWLRGGTGPELWRVAFDLLDPDAHWVSLGAGTRITGGWQLHGLTLPLDATLRARGFVAGGQYNGSTWFVETSIGPVVITKQPIGQTNNAGAPVAFAVEAWGTPPLTYLWRKDGASLQDGPGISGAGTPTLLLSNAFGADAGQYSAIISNTWGSVTSQVAVLTVRDPFIATQPASQWAVPQQSATLSVEAGGTPVLAYQWRKDGTNLLGATASSLTLTNVQSTDAGLYDVLVANSLAVATSAVAVLGVTDPFAPSLGSTPCLAVQPDGKVLVGGALCRLNRDGTRDASFTATATGEAGGVSSLAVQQDGKILVGGSFTLLCGQPRRYFGRLNPDSTLDLSFDPGTIGVSSYVNALLEQPDGRILVGGMFTGLAGQACPALGRLSNDGAFDPSLGTPFAGSYSSYVYCLALQPDGKILVGGCFTNLCGHFCTNVGRLFPDGTLDTSFHAGTTPSTYLGTVRSLALQPDGKILVGGTFNNLSGQSCTNLGRLNPDGTLDTTFKATVEGGNPTTVVDSLAVQADGRILIGGWFRTLCRQTRTYIGRLNPDGTLDTTFNPGADGQVSCLAVQPDGKILAGGNFTSLGGLPRSHLGRLNTGEPASQTLALDGSTLTWLRGGASPELWRATFDFSTDGSAWFSLGEATRIPGGWQLTGLSAPAASNIRARGFIAGGTEGSSWFVESTTRPVIRVGDGDFGFRTNQFGFDLSGPAGRPVVVEDSTNLLHWAPLATNLLEAYPVYFTDPRPITSPQRFYRARLQ